MTPQGVEKFIMEYSNDNGASWESLTLEHLQKQ